MKTGKNQFRLALSVKHYKSGFFFKYLPVFFFALTSLTSLFLFLPILPPTPSMVGGSAPTLGGSHYSLLELQQKNEFVYLFAPFLLLAAVAVIILFSTRFHYWATPFVDGWLSLSFGIRAPPFNAHSGR